MKLMLISHPTFFKGEARLVSSLLEIYDITFHLRKPTASRKEYETFLKNIPEPLHGKIMLHDAYDLKKQFALKGLHFSTRNRALAKHYIFDDKSTSCHSVEESKQMGATFNYHFLSPVFPSISKQGYTGNLDLKAVEGYLQQPRQNLIIALGGVDKEKIHVLRNIGFDGVALLGAVWQNNPADYGSIEKRLRTCLDLCN
jgi:thiamine-phosphate pyrophosphorylase